MATETKEKKYRPNIFNRKYFIMPQFQVRFLLQVLGLTIFVLLGFHLLEVFFLEQIFKIEKTQYLSAEFLYPLLRSKINIVFRGKLIFVGIVLMLWGVIFSHRIAGPMWRIMRILEAIDRGDKDINFNLRRKDHFQDVASRLEELHKKNKI